jgi:predicted small lipoprotein YifL
MGLLRAYKPLLAVAAVLPLIGCGHDGPRTVPVFGKVTFEGRKPPDACRLFFRPVGPSAARPAVAQAERDGTYRVKAFKDADGLLPGTYSLNVSYIDVKPGADPDVESNWIGQSFDAGELDVPEDAEEVQHDVTVPAKRAS